MDRVDDMLLMAYVDGEVDAATAREIEALMTTDAGLAQRARLMREVGATARAAYGDALHEEIPERLIAALGPASRGAAAASAGGALIVSHARRVLSPSRKAGGRAWSFAGWALAASLAAVVVGSGGLYLSGNLEPPGGLQLASSDRWLDHVAGFYDIYAKTKIEEERLLVDFYAEDIPELGKWFGARLGRPLAVPDLTAKGFHLQGGRLLIIGGKPAAQFLYYAESGDLIGLVIAIHEGSDAQARHDKRGHVNIVHWRKAGYAYALVGKVDPQTLQALADDAWHALDTI